MVHSRAECLKCYNLSLLTSYSYLTHQHFMARPIGIGDAVEGLPGSILTALRCSDHTHGSKVYALPTAGIGILQVTYCLPLCSLTIISLILCRGNN